MTLVGKEEVIKSLIPMVNRLAYKYSRGVDQDEYRAVASLALCEAVEAYDGGRGTKLSTWAYRRLSGALKRYRQGAYSLLSYPDTPKGRSEENQELPYMELKENHLTSEPEVDAEGLFDLAGIVLDEDEYYVIYWRHIYNPIFPDSDNMTLEELSVNMGVSIGTVHNIEKRAFKKMKEYLT